MFFTHEPLKLEKNYGEELFLCFKDYDIDDIAIG